MKIFHPHESQAQKFRNFIFGVEDSLVSTVGVLSGVAFADVPRATIFLTGVIIIFVEAFSMGAGSFLSESSGFEYLNRRRFFTGKPAILSSALWMFAGYFCAGFIPLAPYLIADVAYALPASVGSSLIALFILGVWSGNVAKTRMLYSGMRMLFIGGGAIAIGMIVGTLLKI